MKKLKEFIMLSLFVVTMFCMTGCGSTSIDLNKYVTISAEGYDSMGKVTYSFDYDTFEKDYEGKIDLKSDELKVLFGESAPRVLLELCVSNSFDKSSDLSNGDVVVLHWKCDDESAAENFNVKLKYSDIEYKVTNLEEINKIDPFEYVEVSFSGISPNGEASINVTSNEDYIQSIQFTLDENRNLSEGDTVTVIAKEPSNYADNYGYALDKTEKTYTVSGLGKYVTDLSEIPEDIYQKMDKQLQDQITSDVAKFDEGGGKLKGIELIGNYLLTAKKDKSVYNNNKVYFVYKITLDNNLSYYWYGSFADIQLLADKTCTVNLGSYQYSDGWDGNSFEENGYYYYGCKEIESVFNNVVASQLNDYEYISTIE